MHVCVHTCADQVSLLPLDCFQSGSPPEPTGASLAGPRAVEIPVCPSSSRVMKCVPMPGFYVDAENPHPDPLVPAELSPQSLEIHFKNLISKINENTLFFLFYVVECFEL